MFGPKKCHPLEGARTDSSAVTTYPGASADPGAAPRPSSHRKSRPREGGSFGQMCQVFLQFLFDVLIPARESFLGFPNIQKSGIGRNPGREGKGIWFGGQMAGRVTI